MAAALKKDLKVNADLIPGQGGIFDVEADGRLVFSKHKAGRFPENEEVVRLLQTAQGGGSP